MIFSFLAQAKSTTTNATFFTVTAQVVVVFNIKKSYGKVVFILGFKDIPKNLLCVQIISDKFYFFIKREVGTNHNPFNIFFLWNKLAT